MTDMLTADPLVTFAAERLEELDIYVEMYLPAVRDALASGDAVDDLMRTLSAGYVVVYEDVTGFAPDEDAINDFLEDMEDSIGRLIVDPDNVEVQAARLANWFATATLGRATFATATRASTKTWVTMLDDSVRDSHRDLHGEQRDTTDTFTVNTSPPAIMQYPGQPVGPPEAWINCRCVLAVNVAQGAVTADAFAQHDLVWVEGRRTPAVVSKGAKYEPKPSEGKIIKRRAANAEEEKTIARGDWVRVEPGGKKPSDPGYKDAKKSRVRPQNNDGDTETFADDEVEDDQDEPDPPDELLQPVDGDQPVYGVMAPEGVESGDGRSFTEGGLEWRPLPLPLTWQRQNDPEHGGSVIVGRVDTIERRGNLLHWSGVLLDGVPETEEVVMLIAQGALRGVSVDVDKAAVMAADDGDGNSMPKREYAGRVSGLTIVQIPAFDEAYIRLGMDEDFDGEPDDDVMPHIAIEEEQDARAAEELAASACCEECAETGGDCTESFRNYDTEERKKMAESGVAMPDGSFPIRDIEDLKNAIQAIGRASDPDAAKRHIRKRAKAIGEDNLIPDTWSGEVEMFKRGPGWVTEPEATSRIHRYWTKGKGAAKIRWGTGGDFTRCTRQLRKYIEPQYLNRTCAQWHHDALGYWPGELGKPGNPPNTPANRRRAARNASLERNPAMEAAEMFNMVAAAPKVSYPKAWFDNPNLAEPTPLTITPDGRAFGHLATWGVCHIGIDRECVEAPSSITDYAYFKRGTVMTDEGEIRTGVITMNTGHADTSQDFSGTVAHYDHTGTGALDVNIGEDAIGIWFSGAVRGGVSEEDIRSLQAAGQVSGDWRYIGGNLELVAGLAVNVPGFPIPRPALAASGMRTEALVAAGVVAHDAELDVDTIATAVVAALDARQVRTERLAKVMPEADAAREARRAKVLAALD